MKKRRPRGNTKGGNPAKQGKKKFHCPHCKKDLVLRSDQEFGEHTKQCGKERRERIAAKARHPYFRDRNVLRAAAAAQLLAIGLARGTLK